VVTETESARFEEAILPHLDADYNLARWLVRGRATPKIWCRSRV